MEIWIINYTDNCVDKYVVPEQENVQEYIYNSLNYEGKDISWISDDKPLTQNIYYWTKDGIKKS